MPNIEDFGQKIGGARKDVWKSRGIIYDDFSEMNDMERQNLIKKDNVWLKPDWEQKVAAGTPQGVAYWQNEMRKAIPPKPAKATEEAQKNYVEVVGKIRDAVMAVSTPEEVESFYKSFLHTEYIKKPAYRYYVEISPVAYDVITNKVLKVAQARYRTLEREAKEKLFGIPKDQQTYVAAKNRLAVYHYDNDSVKLSDEARQEGTTVLTISSSRGKSWYFLRGDNEFRDIEVWQEGTFFVMDENRRNPVKINFETEKDAQDFIEAYAQKAQEAANALGSDKSKGSGQKRKGAFTPPQLAGVKRDGPNYRGIRSANGDMYLKDLKFRGGEFGNWLNENDRRASLDMGYDALRDLARILQIRPEDVSLDGSLAIAFGARGRGGAGAGLAHYEPDRQVINLTKMSGAGCLAHEWGHALDHAIGISCGLSGLASEGRSGKKPQTFVDLIASMRYKEVQVGPEEMKEAKTPEIEKCRHQLRAWISSVKPSKLPEDLEGLWNDLTDEIVNNAASFTGVEYMSLRRGDQIITKPEVEALSNIRKSTTNHAIPRDAKRQIAMWAKDLARHETAAKSMEPQIRRVKTDFFKGAEHFDNVFSKAGHGYWQSECEMFARAFDCYVSDKLKAAGVRSDYLTAHADAYVMPGPDGTLMSAVPKGEERALLNEKFDALLVDLKERGILHHFEEEMEIAAPVPDERQRQNIEQAPAEKPEPDRPVHYEQMSLDALLFSAESRKQPAAQKVPQSQDLSR